MPAFADELAAVVAYLRAHAGVAALAGTRVYATELPADQAAQMPRTAVLVNDAGLGSGGGAMGMMNRSNLPFGQSTKDLRCYGATAFESRRLWNVVAGALKDLGQSAGGYRVAIPTQGTVRLISATPAAPAQMREPEVDWPVTFSTFNLAAIDTAIA